MSDNEQTQRPDAVASRVWLGVGDFVSVERWDATERQPNRIGTPARVSQIETGDYSQTGIMVTVVGTTGETLRVDMNWLRPYPPNDPSSATRRPNA
jgi:hypothetical protein